ncbi:alpha/beta fold hydrolase [Haloplanus aerogenes]|uniref:Alpha/beta fold hydrolase n=1 Tax=Haloplanus aerogenes TaxID=660522 RepID=A0A3M0CWD9_9EURY|nr:alpha/beta fold hydrolase [Haloplanus aerogenes]AZH24068.1 alpha/beta fold hydrolase [Haloplanus aerogenes]RMB13155.1 pimeloyl-ACP methyl ester carboxylesterase [Haloplanus aerogenes]
MTRYDEWTAAQESTTVTVDGHDLDVAYYDDGSGDPVVFLHGIPTNSYLWRDVIDPIADRRRVIVPDMVGYGASAMHDGFDRSIRAQERMLDALLTALDIQSPSLVGHDLGGGVFLRYAAHNPDAVDELVLSNAVAYDSWPIQLVTDLGLPETARTTSPEEMQTMLDDLFRDTLVGDDPDEALVEGMTAPWNSAEGVTSLVRNAASTNTNHTTEIDPTAITADTLLLWGADDEFQPIQWAERLSDDIERAELVGLDGASHWVMADRPDAYRTHLSDFLR